MGHTRKSLCVVVAPLCFEVSVIVGFQGLHLFKLIIGGCRLLDADHLLGRLDSLIKLQEVDTCLTFLLQHLCEMRVDSQRPLTIHEAFLEPVQVIVTKCPIREEIWVC